MKKKVLHILNSNSYSGAENVVITIINAFDKMDAEIDFVYVSPDGKIRDVLEKKGITFEPVSCVCVSEIKRVVKKHKPDIIHAHDFTASVISSIAGGKTPLISHIHNNSPWLQRPCLKSFAYLVSSIKYKKILGVSESVFAEYIFNKAIMSKEIVVSNPIDTQRVVQLADNASCNDGYDICFLGRLSEAKDPLRFIELVKTLSVEQKITAVMIGDGELRAAVEAKIKKDNLSDIITLKGFMENPYGILKNSKLLCVPSKWEGFGLVAVEALSLGVPVVAANVGGLPCIVDGKSGAICDSDAEFVASMKQLLMDAMVWKKYSDGVKVRATELDNVKDYCIRLNKIYENIECAKEIG